MGAAVGAAAIGGGMAAASGALGMYFQHLENKKAWHRQKKVLQNQIKWRVQDAKQSGIHPLAALGLSPASGPTATDLPGLGDIGGAAGQAARTYEDVKLAQLAQEQEQKKTKILDLQGQILQKKLDGFRATGSIGSTGDPVVDGLLTDGQVNAGVGSGLEGNPSVVIEPSVVPSARSTGAGIILSGVKPFQEIQMDKDGYVWLTVRDPQSIDQNAIAKSVYYGSQGARWAINAIVRDPGKYARWLPTIPKGMVWIFDKNRGQFRRVSGKPNLVVRSLDGRRTIPLRVAKPQERLGPGDFIIGP